MEVPPEPGHTAKEHLSSYARIDIILAFFFQPRILRVYTGLHLAVLDNSAIMLGRLPNSLIGGRQISFFFSLAFLTPKTLRVLTMVPETIFLN